MQHLAVPRKSHGQNAGLYGSKSLKEHAARYEEDILLMETVPWVYSFYLKKITINNFMLQTPLHAFNFEIVQKLQSHGA